MDLLRNLDMWSSEIYWQNENMIKHKKDRPILFLSPPTYTEFPKLKFFGMHGNKLFDDIDLLYTLPKNLLRIPILRELLLFSGAIEDSRDTVFRFLKKGHRAICFSYGGMAIPEWNAQDEILKVPRIDSEFLQFMVKNRIIIIPVIFTGEVKRFPALLNYDDTRGSSIYTKSVLYGLRVLRKLCMRLFGYPFPILRGFDRHESVSISISAPVNADEYELTESDIDKLRKSIYSAWASMSNINDNALEIQE